MEESEQLDFSSPIPEYKPGDIMRCKIEYRQAGGYTLRLPNQDLRDAFLPTSVQLRPGDEIEVFFVCTDGKRIFLSMTEDEFKRRMQLRSKKPTPGP
jgi:hypothetical protein